MDTDILVKVVYENIAILKLNRAKQANALNKELFLKLTEELDQLRWNDAIRVVVITGEGKKVFCAGIDLKERGQKQREEILLEREKIIKPFYLTLGDFPKPTIAALNGSAFGGGAELALTCDMRVAVQSAKFSQSEIKWGMIPSCGACQRLRLIVGMGIAKEIILTGRVVEAEEAYRVGIYNRLVTGENVMDAAIKLAKEISKNPSIAVTQAKKALDSGADISVALDFDFEASKECFFAGDALSKPKTF